jgi:hypothetical protein
LRARLKIEYLLFMGAFGGGSVDRLAGRLYCNGGPTRQGPMAKYAVNPSE